MSEPENNHDVELREAVTVGRALLAMPDFVARFGEQSKVAALLISVQATVWISQLQAVQAQLNLPDLKLQELLSWTFQAWIQVDDTNINLLAGALTSALKA